MTAVYTALAGTRLDHQQRGSVCVIKRSVYRIVFNKKKHAKVSVPASSRMTQSYGGTFTLST